MCAQRFALNHAPTDKAFNAIGKLQIIPCRVIRDSYNDPGHPDHLRAWAHVGHMPGVLCVNPLYFALPPTVKIGIVLHEIGHIGCGGGDEMEADLWVRDNLGVEIKYGGPGAVQEVDESTANKVLSTWEQL